MTPNVALQEALAVFPAFSNRVSEEHRSTRPSLEVMQVNVGHLCNLSCRHCHVGAGPSITDREMTRETMEHVLRVLKAYDFKQLDITGGAPEMNPHFEWFIEEASRLDLEIIVRSNLVILAEPSYEHLPQKYADLGITLFASVPHYTERQVEKQRGSRTFDAIVRMLQQLNRLGYGRDADKQLNLVYNPLGAFLPPDQTALEKEYRDRMEQDFGIVFNHLFAIANNPNGRFGDRLLATGNLEGYLDRLIQAFNADTVPNMMCRNQLSVAWDGTTYDCDFNQAAGLPCHNGLTIADYAETLPDLQRDIAFGNHCYGCTAGAGSSCGGATA